MQAPKPTQNTCAKPKAGKPEAGKPEADKPKPIHKLDLYRLAVQQPWAQVNWLANAYAAHYPGRWATHLHEDFCGGGALAMAWVAHDHDHTAAAIDNHGPTLRFAQKRAGQLAKPDLRRGSHGQSLDTSRLMFHHADVMDATLNQTLPKADILIALNFSINIYHDWQSLVAYFKNVRHCLGKEGLFVFDNYGGPGAWRVSTQHRRVRPEANETTTATKPVKPPAFDYWWDQQDVDPLTGLVRNAIHFKTRAQGRIDNAFVYHWRLWTLPELLEALQQAGFGRTQVWCTPGQLQGQGDEPLYGDLVEPVDRIGPCEDYLAYVSAER